MDYKVLIVDDEKELSEYTAKYFNISGVSTAYVLDAKSALQFFEENMGYTVCRRCYPECTYSSS